MKVLRELGSNRRETGWSLSVESEGEVMRRELSTKGLVCGGL